MVTDDGFLLQAVNNDKQGLEIGEVFFFFSLVHHYVLTLSICPSLCQIECVVQKRMKSPPSETFSLAEKTRATLSKLLECLIQQCVTEIEKTA